MKKLFIKLNIVPLTFGFIFFLSSQSFAQNIGINKIGAKPSSAAILDLNTGNAGSNMGFLPPHISLSATNSALPVSAPDTGLIVYNTKTINDVVPGYYYWTGSSWNLLSTGGSLGTGTTDYLARWTSPTTLGIGITEDNGTDVGIGTSANSGRRLDVVEIDPSGVAVTVRK